MKLKKIFTALALLLSFAWATPASAELKFGVVGGLNLSKMSFSGGDKSLWSSDNRCGWYIGPKAQFTLPIIGLGLDASIQYSQRRLNVDAQGDGESQTYKSIEVPINVRYDLGLGSMASVYIATGPQFGFNCDKSIFRDADISVKDANVTWNVGVGVTLLSHLQVGAGYNFAVGKWAESKDPDYDLNVKANTWQVQVAYLF